LINGWKSGVPGFIRACAPDAAISVITEPGCAPMYNPADTPVHLVDDIADLTAVRALALALNKGQPFDFVVSPAERSLPAGGYLRSLLGLPGIGFETANKFSNKAAMKRALGAAGLPIAPFRAVCDLDEVEHAAEEVGWPVIIKPAVGGGSQNSHLLRSTTDLLRLANSPAAKPLERPHCQLMVEHFVELRCEYHCEGVVHDGVVEFASVGRYHLPLFNSVDQFTGSVALPASDPVAKEVRALHDATVTTLGLATGITHMEALHTPDGILVGEITCRPPASITRLVQLQHGVDIWSAFIETSLGKPATLSGWSGSTANGYVVSCELPARPGLVRRISPDDTWADLTEVVEVTMNYRVGDVIGTRLNSSSCAGLVFLRVTDLGSVPQLRAEVARRYVLDVVQDG
jgi:hypothetical protein